MFILWKYFSSPPSHVSRLLLLKKGRILENFFVVAVLDILEEEGK